MTRNRVLSDHKALDEKTHTHTPRKHTRKRILSSSVEQSTYKCESEYGKQQLGIGEVSLATCLPPLLSYFEHDASTVLEK